MSNLLDKASIILTPTAYNNGEALCVKPSDGSGDFDFSRNSAATRVNAQGLVENVQILSSNLVQNGDFSEEGVEEVSNGSFSQEGSEEIVNGSFDTDSDWSGVGSNGFSISGGKLNLSDVAYAKTVTQGNVTVVGKTYKVTFEISDYVKGAVRIFLGGSVTPTQSSNGVFTSYVTVSANTAVGIQTIAGGGTTLSIDNVSVREVGQDWTLGTGWSIGEDKAISDGSNGYSFLQQTGTVENGKSYKLTYSVTNYVSGTIEVGVGGASNNNIQRNSVGDFVEYHTSNGTNLTVISRNFIGSITNISVKEVGQNWTLGSFTSIGNNVANIVNSTGELSLQQDIGVSQKTIKLTYTISNYSSGGIRPQYGAVNGLNRSANGTYTEIITGANVSSNLSFFSVTANTTATITNISVIEITTDTNLPRINYEGFSYQDALGSELVVNGTFDSDTAWSKGAGWSIANGVATHTGSASYLSQSILNPNTQYKVKIKVSQASGSNFVQIYMGNSPASVLIQNVGEYEYIFTSQSIQTLGFALRGAGNVGIDNVSVKEYLGQEVVPESGCGSWLFEPQSTNLVTDSEDYAQWTPTGVSVTSNSTTSPDGLINGTLLSTNGGTSSRLLRNYGLPTSATAKVLSVYAKANLSNFIQLLLSGDAQSYVNFDVSNGVVGTSGTKSTGEIQSVGNGWYRCIAYFDSTTIFGASSFVALTTSNSAGYCGGATSDDLNVYIWGSQYEEQTYATSYIPTEGSTVTRNQDLCTNGGSLASINSTLGTLYFEGAALSDLVESRLSINNGTNIETVQIRQVGSVSNTYNVGISNGSVNIFFTVSDITSYNKIAISYKENETKIFSNGILIATDTNAITFPPNSLNQISFDRGDNSFFFYGKTKALAVWKEALSDQELTELTTI